MTDAANLVVERESLVQDVVRDAVKQLGGRREPPTVLFERDRGGDANGRYERGRNEVVIRVDGFLDDPEIATKAIRATAAHEVGHWADPELSSRMQTLRYLSIPFGIAALAAPLVVFAMAGPHSLLPLLGIWISVGLVVAYLGVTAAFRWPGEYYADHAAAQVVGEDAVLAMLQTLSSGGLARCSPTHPTPEARISRLRAECGQTA